MSQSKNPYDAMWRLFCSLQLTVAVLVLLLVGCVAGMFWDQTLTLQQHLDSVANNTVSMWLLCVFELGDAFHSWWFSGLLLLLALNLTACSIQRLPPIWLAVMNPPRRLSDALLRLAQHAHVMRIAIPPEAVMDSKTATNSFDTLPCHVQQALALALPKGEYWREGDTHFWFAQRHRFARLGVYFIHAALLIVMFGSVLHTTCGVSGMLSIPAGESAHVLQARGPGGITYGYDLGFWVRCNDFHLKQFVDGSPRVFASDVTVFDAANPATKPLQATIRVGEPLHIRGYTLYQASYQRLKGPQRVRLALGRRGESATVAHNVSLGEPIPLFYGPAPPCDLPGCLELSKASGAKARSAPPCDPPGCLELSKASGSKGVQPHTVTPVRVIDDYQGLGEALELRHVDAQGRVEYLTVFRRYPHFDRLVRGGLWHVTFQGSDQRYATVLSVSATWLMPCVFAGFMLLCVGLAMAFGMRYRRYYARARPLGKGMWEIAVAGFIHRRRNGFHQEFAKLVRRIRLSMQ